MEKGFDFLFSLLSLKFNPIKWWLSTFKINKDNERNNDLQLSSRIKGKPGKLSKNIFTERSSLIVLRRLGVDFTNVLSKALMREDHKSVKIQSNCQNFFALSGSALVKAGCKMLEKLTTGG